ncbi:hypothetical protein E2542_SST13227 [Spatholobus suberectus]|nr:hypothetical protein E2542_SST13227 [Spatholobus suberectus]
MCRHLQPHHNTGKQFQAWQKSSSNLQFRHTQSTTIPQGKERDTNSEAFVNLDEMLRKVPFLPPQKVSLPLMKQSRLLTTATHEACSCPCHKILVVTFNNPMRLKS